MNDIYKSGLVILNEDSTKFLVTMNKDKAVQFWLMPGGRIEEGETPEEALVREIKEELTCELDISSLTYITEHAAPAAGRPGVTLHIKLYMGTVNGTPVASSEVKELGWLSKEDATNPVVSEAIRDYILPDLVERGILQ